jgi:dTDP-4-amino-4,6-dideoxygalactose transaminase
VDALEERLARFSGAAHVVTCASGTDALLLALMASGVGPGDAVAVPAFTFVAPAEVVAVLGATPVFVDVRPDTFTLDAATLPAAVEAASARGLRLVGAVAVDLFGQPADYDAIAPVAAAHGLWVLADAAQSFGAALHGRRVGTLAAVTATSFFPAKPLGAYGDGGAVLTDDPGLAQAVRSLRVHGQGQHRYEHVRIGLNARLDTLQAAVLLEKLGIFEEELAARQVVADRYHDGLADVVQVPEVLAGATSTWAQYTIRVEGRDQVVEALGRWGVPTAVHYPRPLHHQPAFRTFPRAGPLGVSERLAREVLSLPMHPYLDHTQQELVMAAVREVVEK